MIAQAVVLRRAEYRDNDRMLTLLSPDLGPIDALCRGCRRVKSPLIAAGELFAYGEYTFYKSRGSLTVTACDLKDAFYPLRLDLDKLAYASYFAGLTRLAAQPGEPAPKLFTLLLRALARLSYKEEYPPQTVAAAFLLHYSAVLGYAPELHRCVSCGREIGFLPRYAFDIEGGGLLCNDCAENTRAQFVTEKQLYWLCDVLKNGIERSDAPFSDAPFALLRTYAESRLQAPAPRLKLFLR